MVVASQRTSITSYISIESTVSVVVCILPTLTVEGSESV